ncbi:hypothetical protein PIROE2DRAFT_6474 [Piromyces sp. E2]|nr:hypothetical protein PIROE2DRAFT_6474 [Piromyces sp. E2]|eukprot:OUM66333.1 hypothetical protein PIROE2DRAFT_6474 [Piromyces sp. E2]
MNNPLTSTTTTAEYMKWSDSSTTTTAEYMKWSDSEISMLLQWLKKPENMDLFFNKKKVTAIKKMREFLQQKTERQIKNKLASLESNYKKTKQKLIANWDLTAASAQDSEAYAIAEEKIKRTCPFYDDLDEIFGSYTNVVQSPLNVDLANAATSNNAAISAAIDRSDIDNINVSPMDVNGINGVNGVNGIGLGRNGLANSSSATINGHSNLGSELEIHNKRNIRKASNINQFLIDSNLSSLLQIIDSRIIQRSDLILNKTSSSLSSVNNEQILLLKERLYDKKVQSRERQMDKKKKMFETKMRLKEKKLELYSKELEIRRFEAEVKMEEIKLKRLLYESTNTNNGRGNHIGNNQSTTSLGLSTITSTATPAINVSPFGSGNLNNSFNSNNHSNHFSLGGGSGSSTTNGSEGSATSFAVINGKHLLNDEEDERLCLIHSSNNMNPDNNAAAITTVNSLNFHTKPTTISSSNTTTSIPPINPIPTAPTSTITGLMNSSLPSPSSYSDTNDEKQ